MTQLEPDRLDGYGGLIICNHLGEIDHAVNGVNPVVCALTGGLPSASLIDRIGGQNHTHRPVKINPQNGQFKLNEGNPISCHLLVVDESMLAFPRTSQLPKSVDTSEALIFVSDVDQLASVGPGQFPADLLD